MRLLKSENLELYTKKIINKERFIHNQSDWIKIYDVEIYVLNNIYVVIMYKIFIFIMKKKLKEMFEFFFVENNYNFKLIIIIYIA